MVFYFKVRPEAGDFVIYMGLDKHENEDLIKYGLPEDMWFHVDKLSSAHVYLRLNRGGTMDTITDEMLEDCAQLVKANSIQGNKLNNIDVVYTPWANLKKTGAMDVGQVGFHNSKLVRSVKVEKRVNDVVNRLNKTKVERQVDFKGRAQVDTKGLDWMVLRGARGREAMHLMKGPLPAKQSIEAMEVVTHHNIGRERMCGELIGREGEIVAAEKEGRESAERAEKKVFIREKNRKAAEEKVERERMAEARSYTNLMKEDKMTSNKDIAAKGKTCQELEEDFM